MQGHLSLSLNPSLSCILFLSVHAGWQRYVNINIQQMDVLNERECSSGSLSNTIKQTKQQARCWWWVAAGHKPLGPCQVLLLAAVCCLLADKQITI